MSDPKSWRPDFLVVGGGIIGASVACAIRRRWPDLSVTLIEKETSCGRHASGRNSGVLHAGFYYDEDSLKARFARVGNERLGRYCDERSLPIDHCGKLIVARREEDLPWLDELARRGSVNDVELHSVTRREAAEIEPRARTIDRALFSPRTAVVESGSVVESVVSDVRSLGGEIHTDTRYLKSKRGSVETNRGRYSAGFVINCAGLQADQVAHDYGFGRDYRILPFKGLYLTSTATTPTLRTHVYPVPDMAQPFLGVHLTLAVSGHVKIGPTALPALWREQYRGLRGFRLTELLEIVPIEARMFVKNTSGFRGLAWQELRKQSKRALLALARELVPDVTRDTGWTWGVPGIRAQLQHVQSQELVTDFVLEGDDRSLHVLNAVSPAFTCALPFADFVVDAIADRESRDASASRRDGAGSLSAPHRVPPGEATTIQ